MFILLLFQVALHGCGWKYHILETSVLRPPLSENIHHVFAELVEMRDEWRLGIHFKLSRNCECPTGSGLVLVLLRIEELV